MLIDIRKEQMANELNAATRPWHDRRRAANSDVNEENLSV
jgi:hypothetical protein